MLPSWVRIQQWDGEKWVSAEQEFPAYYRGLAGRYEAVDRWLREGPDNDRCLAAEWVQENPDFFESRAARVLGIATSNNP